MKALLIALMLAASPAAAAGLSDVIMAPGLFKTGDVGEILRYQHSRHLPPRAEDQALPGAGRDQAVPEASGPSDLILSRVQAGEAMQLVMAQEVEGKARQLGSFPPGMANPVLLYFLENVVRNLAAQTGGSPFYFKNRLKEALLAADLSGTGVQSLQLQPLVADDRAAQMGVFASLTLTFTLDPAHPERLIELKADTAAGADGYTEHLILLPES